MVYIIWYGLVPLIVSFALAFTFSYFIFACYVFAKTKKQKKYSFPAAYSERPRNESFDAEGEMQESAGNDSALKRWERDSNH